jgi:hypothetical protein
LASQNSADKSGWPAEQRKRVANEPTDVCWYQLALCSVTVMCRRAAA